MSEMPFNKRRLRMQLEQDEHEDRVGNTFRALIEWMEEGENWYFSDFCTEYGIAPSTLSRWAKKYPYYRPAYEYARELQKAKIAKGAMFKKLDGAFCKWFLSAAHGMTEGRDETEIDKPETGSSKKIADIKRLVIEYADSVSEASKEPLRIERQI